jgi:hypothetical protein
MALDAPPENAPSSACMPSTFVFPFLPEFTAMAMADSQPIGEPIQSPAPGKCYKIDTEKLNAIAAKAWAQGKKTVELELALKNGGETQSLGVNGGTLLRLSEGAPGPAISIRPLSKEGKQTSRIDPPADFSLEINNIRPNRRLYLMVSPKGRAYVLQDCSSLFGSLSSLFPDGDPELAEAVANAKTMDSLPLEKRTKLSQALTRFSEKKNPNSWPGISLKPFRLSGTQKKELANDWSKNNGPYALLSVNGSELRENTNVLVSVTPENPGAWDGKQLSFSACQFGLDYTKKTVARVEPFLPLMVQLGASKCQTISECLRMVDEKALDGFSP